MRLKQILDLIKDSVTAWVDDYAPSMGAAIAYYTLFSITPLLIIGATTVFGELQSDLDRIWRVSVPSQESGL